MIRARVVDTSVLIASVDAGDARQAEAKGLIGGPGPVVVPNEVLVETLGVLKSTAGRQAAKEFQQILMATDGIELGHESDLGAALTLQVNFPTLSIVDACAVVLAWRLGAELDTFDDAQRDAWASR